MEVLESSTPAVLLPARGPAASGLAPFPLKPYLDFDSMGLRFGFPGWSWNAQSKIMMARPS